MSDDSVRGMGGGAVPFGAPALRQLPVDRVRPNPDQPRRRFDADALDGLASSLRERGLLQPILVRPAEHETFELIAGERRWRAAQLAGLTTLPAYIRAQTDDAEAFELALIENAAREDLSPVEEARALSTLIDDLGLTQAALARRIGRSRSDLANTVRLLALPDAVLDEIDAGRLSKGHGKALLGAPDEQHQRELAQRALAGDWSVRRLERAVAELDAPSPKPERAAQQRLADDLGKRLTPLVPAALRVRARGDGFAVQILLRDATEAEALVQRLSRPGDDAAVDIS